MMETAILNFSSQFAYKPKIENAKNLKKKKSFLLTGMGGSHLNADLLLAVDPLFDLAVHRDYGLPVVSKQKMKDSLFVASSYSGNTEEVVMAYKEARKKKLDTAVIAVGGKLIELAKRDGVPYIQLPDTGIQPRSALGYSFSALLKLTGRNDLLKQMLDLETKISPKKLRKTGKLLAKKMTDHVPVIYCSRVNETLAWNWKIKLNETGKVPAFYNVLPELNHNEMTGFDAQKSSKHLTDHFAFVFLKDSDDHPKIQKRMQIVEKLYKKRKLPVYILDMKGANRLEKLFNSLLIADWTAVHTAELYGLESEQVPMVEEFKRLIK
jgi:glucose/mannose-6-phosphate isomerase